MNGKWLALPMLGLVFGVSAYAVKLDDTLSPQQRVSVQLQWANEINVGRKIESSEFNALKARIPGLEIRLNTTAYVGRIVQIYLGLPLQVRGLKSPSAMRIEWQTRGVFASGSTFPGSRGLIFQGVVPAAVMSDFFDFTIHVDGRYIDRGLQFDPQFELEILK